MCCLCLEKNGLPRERYVLPDMFRLSSFCVLLGKAYFVGLCVVCSCGHRILGRDLGLLCNLRDQEEMALSWDIHRNIVLHARLTLASEGKGEDFIIAFDGRRYTVVARDRG